MLFAFLVGWKHDSVENAVIYCQPGELFRDLNLTLHLDHLRVGQKQKRKCNKFTCVTNWKEKLKKSGEYSECLSGKCVYTPK